MGQQEIYKFLKQTQVWMNSDEITCLMKMNKPKFFRDMSKMKKFPQLFKGLEIKKERETRVQNRDEMFIPVKHNIYYYRVKTLTLDKK